MVKNFTIEELVSLSRQHTIEYINNLTTVLKRHDVIDINEYLMETFFYLFVVLHGCFFKTNGWKLFCKLLNIMLKLGNL